MDRCDYDPVSRNGKKLIDPLVDRRGNLIGASPSSFFSTRPFFSQLVFTLQKRRSFSQQLASLEYTRLAIYRRHWKFLEFQIERSVREFAEWIGNYAETATGLLKRRSSSKSYPKILIAKRSSS